MDRKRLVFVVFVCVLAGILFVLVTRRSRNEIESDVPVVDRQVSDQMPAVVEPYVTTQVVDVVRVDSDVVANNDQSEIREKLRNMNMSPAVRTLVGMAGSKDDYRARAKTLLALTKSLPNDDVEAIRLFLYLDLDKDSSIRSISFSALKNNALDVLIRQDKLPEGLGFQIVEMFLNEDNDSVWRDYCIQYLNPYYEASNSGDSSISDSEYKKIAETYLRAMEDSSRSYAGSALLGMHLLSEQYPEFDKKKIKEVAVRLVNDDGALEANKITGLLLCGQLGRTEVLPETRILAQSGETVTLRMAAIATLGELGDVSDGELLKSLTGSSEKRIQTIANTALVKLSKRM